MCHRDTRIRLTVHLATNTARYLGAHLISVHAENQVSVQVTRTKGFWLWIWQNFKHWCGRDFSVKPRVLVDRPCEHDAL